MKKITVKLNFLWDTEIDSKEVSITVPDNITTETVIKALKETHEYLCFEDDTGIYELEGRNAKTLLEQTCGDNDWTWEEILFDIELEFN